VEKATAVVMAFILASVPTLWIVSIFTPAAPLAAVSVGLCTALVVASKVYGPEEG
jgi:hypothetical protein